MKTRYHQINMPVNLTAIAAEYLSARNRLRLAKLNTHASREARTRLNTLGTVLSADMALRTQANFGEFISLVDCLDSFVFDPKTTIFTVDWYLERADDLIDEYMEFASAAVISMAKAVDSVEDAFSQLDERDHR